MARADSGGAAEQDQKNYYDTPTQARQYTTSYNYDPRNQPWSTPPTATTRTGASWQNPANRYGSYPMAGQPPPPPGPWTPYSAPGSGEQWWAAHKSQFDQPGQAANYWNGVQGWFTNPTEQEQRNQGYSNTLGNTPGALENLYGQYYGSGAFTNPGSGEQWWAQNGGQYGQASEGERALSGVVGQYGQSGAMEDWYRQHGGDFSQAGDMEQFYRQNNDRLQGNTPLGANADRIDSTYNQAQNTGRFFNATAGDLLAPSYTESFANNYQRMPGYNEQFLLGGGATEGLDSLYARLGSQEARRLDKRAAAGGAFNSGAALRAQEESGADLAAQHVRDYMQASQAADVSRLADQSFGLNLMQGADTGLRGRISLGLSGANMSDSNALARAAGLQSLYTGVGDETRQNIGLGANMAQSSQADWLARELGGEGAAQGANNAWLARLAGQTGAASDLANQWLSRMNSGGAAASRAQGDEQSRIQLGLGAAGNAQNAWMDRYKTAFGMNNDIQSQILARIMGGGTLATGASNEDYRRLTGGLDAAFAAQNAKQNRENGVFQNLNTLGQEQAGTYGGQQGQARDEQTRLFMDQINGMLKSGQITAEEAQAKYGAQMQALGLVIQGGQIVAGGMGGVPTARGGGGTAGAGGGYAPPPTNYPINY